MRFAGFRLIPYLLLALVVVGSFAPAGAPGAPVQSGQHPIFSTAPLEIVTGSGHHSFTVELAETREQRARGLMFRPRLGADAGMLFVYPTDRLLSMWMKNTLIPLDMLFVAADGRIVGIHQRAAPHSLRAIGSGVPARAVVELAGGTVARLGIRIGDRVINDRFRSAR